MQDASITVQPEFDGQAFALGVQRGDGGAFSEEDIQKIYAIVNPDQGPDGINFTLSE